jgi:hypothetical protein
MADQDAEATNPNTLPADDSQSPASPVIPPGPPGKTAEEWQNFESEGVGPLPVLDTQLHPEPADEPAADEDAGDD